MWSLSFSIWSSHLGADAVAGQILEQGAAVLLEATSQAFQLMMRLGSM
jgi:hypothetical protein